MSLAYENRGWSQSVYAQNWMCPVMNASDVAAGLIIMVNGMTPLKVRKNFVDIMKTLSDIATDLDVDTSRMDYDEEDVSELDDWELLAGFHDEVDFFHTTTDAYRLAMIALRNRMDAIKADMKEVV